MPEQIKKHPCPKCANTLTTGTVLAGNTELKAGDVGICGHCGTILVLDADLNNRIAGVRDVIGLPAHIMITLCQVQRAILADRGARN